MFFGSKKDELFGNFKRSVRGSIRKAPNALTWAFSLDKLHRDHGLGDPQAIIKNWNEESSKASHLIGGKAQSVKNVLSLPKDAKVELFNSVQTLGWDTSPWTDDVLGSKKILPGFAPRGASKHWNDRTRTTPSSCVHMIKHITAEYEASPNSRKRKLTKTEAEDVAIWAAFVEHVAKETQHLLPIADDVLYNGFIKKFADADPKVTSEVTMACSEKNDKFTPGDLGTLNDLMQQHRGAAPVQPNIKMTISQQKVEEAQFDFIVNQVSYDFQAFKVLDSKLANFHSAREHIKRTWKIQAHRENLDAATVFLDTYTRICCWEDKDAARRDFDKFHSDIISQLQILPTNVVITLKSIPPPPPSPLTHRPPPPPLVSYPPAPAPDPLAFSSSYSYSSS